MNDFLIYAARLQDAGITSLWVSLGSDKERTRLMHVTPDATVPRELAEKYPTRTFELDGSDKLLSQLKDDMVYGNELTMAKLLEAIKKHPLAADDLTEWFADYAQGSVLTDEELNAAADECDTPENVETAERMRHYLKGLMRGMDSAKERATVQKPEAA